MKQLLKQKKTWLLTAVLFGFVLAQVAGADAGAPGSSTNPVVTKSYADKVLDPLRKQVAALQYEITILKNGSTSTGGQNTGWFSDVPSSHWAYKDIKTLTSKGIITVKSGSAFGPSVPATRAELAVYIVKSLKLPLLKTTTIKFTDLSSKHWAYQYIITAQAKGILSGFPDGQFKPDSGVTRAQMAVMLKKAYSLPRNNSVKEFKDVPKTYWAYENIMCLADQGISKGFSDGTFKPADPVRRAEVAVFLAKTMAR